MQQPNTINYGATGHVANNPFAMAGVGSIATSTISEETMQPDATLATDTYQSYDYTTPQPTAGVGMAGMPGGIAPMGQMPTYEQQYPQYQQQQQ